MLSPDAPSRAAVSVQSAMKSPVVPELADTSAQWVTFGGSALNGPNVNEPVLCVSAGSPAGADHVTAWRAYPEVVTSAMVARVVVSDGAEVSSAK